MSIYLIHVDYYCTASIFFVLSLDFWVSFCFSAWARGVAPRCLAHLRQFGFVATGMARLRLVTHLDVDPACITHALASMRAFATTHAERLMAHPETD